MAARKTLRRNRVRGSIRNKISGTSARPRLSVFRSNKDIYAQVIDDVSGVTLASASSKGSALASENGNKTDIAGKVGELLAENAKGAGVETVVFDRGGYLYHGCVKALAEGARKGGLKF